MLYLLKLCPSYLHGLDSFNAFSQSLKPHSMFKKKSVLIVIFLIYYSQILAQDVGVTKINNPQSGCNLGSETVSIEVTNFGNTLFLTTIPLSYQLDGGTPVTQSTLFTTFNASSTQTVTFSVALNMSGNYGKHSLKAYSNLSSDTKRSNDTFTITFTNYKPSDGGLLLADDTVCSTANGDTLILTKKTGVVVQWESNSGSGWNNLSNTDTFYIYSNLAQSTQYRVLVKNGLCASDYSDTATITVETQAKAGVLEKDRTICAGGSGDTLRLKGYNGTIKKWQSDDGSGWKDIANTDDTLIYSSPTVTKKYRVIVEKTVCTPDTSNIITIMVYALSKGGIIIPAMDTVCNGKNNDTLVLTKKIGTIVQWESNIGSGWNPVVNTDTFLIYQNITTSTSFRVLVKNGLCASDYSNVATVTIDNPAKAGVLERDRSICAGGKGDTLRLKNYEGKIRKWQSNTGGGWIDINNTSNTLIYPAPVANKKYRVIVAKNVCKPDTSNSVTISIISASSGGNIIPLNSFVCSGTNHDTLTLINSKGDRKWEFSDDGGFTWLSIVNRDTFQIYNNLVASRKYRVLVEASGCASVYSDIATVNVLAPPKGGIVERDKSICGGTNKDTLVLKQFSGSIIKWQSNNGGGWIDIQTTNDTLFVSAIMKTTRYRAIVGNSACANDTSTIATLKVIATTFGGNIIKSDSVCRGLNSNILVLKDHVGDIRWWERSTDNGVSWSPIANFDTTQNYVNLNQTTWYRVLVEGTNCPRDYSDTAIITVYIPLIKITAGGNTSFCKGDSVILNAKGGFNNYSWSSGQSTQSIKVKTDGKYKVTVTDKRGCKNSDSILITVYPLPVADAGVDATISLGASVRLKGKGGVKYLWKPGERLSDSTLAEPLASPLATTKYTLTVRDNNGCSDSDVVIINVIKDYNIHAKNIITPNGDGINDTWKIDNILPYEKSTVTIVNRYGYIVYEKTGYDNSWDGTDGKEKVSDGTYYYIISFDDNNKIYKGHITVLSK